MGHAAAVYCATKFTMRALPDGLRQGERLPRNWRSTFANQRLRRVSARGSVELRYLRTPSNGRLRRQSAGGPRHQRDSFPADEAGRIVKLTSSAWLGSSAILIGAFLKERLYRTLIVIPAVLAVIAVALVAFENSLMVTAVLLGIWGTYWNGRARWPGGRGWQERYRTMLKPAAA